jgi:hypothetical protein
MRGEKFLVIYFLFFAALSGIAIMPGGTLFLLIVTGMALPLFGIPGFMAAASPTILLYSASLLPLWAALTRTPRRPWRIVAAVLVPIAVAGGPGLISLTSTALFAERMSRSDFRHQANPQPKTVELIGDGYSGVFAHVEAIGDKYASCNDVCLRLLFNREVEWVRMTRIPVLSLNARSGITSSVTYRIESRESCPMVSAMGQTIDKALRDRLIAGDCLIMNAGGDGASDASVKFITTYYGQDYPHKLPNQAPSAATIVSVKELDVTQRQGGTFVPILRQTETTSETLALPFYFGAEIHMQGGYNGATIGRQRSALKAVDLAQVLRDTFGFKLDPISPPPRENPLNLVDRILSLPTTVESFSTEQQDIINETLKPMVSKATLSDSDVALVTRVVRDERITSGQIGVTLQSLFRNKPEQLSPLVPLVIQRLTVFVPERVGHYQSSLGWALMVYPASALQPHRQTIVAIIEAQPDWPTAGLLTRIAELEGDSSDLIASRLSARSGTTRHAAAMAVCRATPENWAKLEPIVLAHLSRENKAAERLDNAERTLLYALIRFGRKETAESIMRSIDPMRAALEQQIASLEENFPLTKCR